MADLLKHAYDLHIHCGPDIIPRSVAALEMAERAVKRGMKGFAIKSQFTLPRVFRRLQSGPAIRGATQWGPLP